MISSPAAAEPHAGAHTTGNSSHPLSPVGWEEEIGRKMQNPVGWDKESQRVLQGTNEQKE